MTVQCYFTAEFEKDSFMSNEILLSMELILLIYYTKGRHPDEHKYTFVRITVVQFKWPFTLIRVLFYPRAIGIWAYNVICLVHI